MKTNQMKFCLVNGEMQQFNIFDYLGANEIAVSLEGQTYRFRGEEIKNFQTIDFRQFKSSVKRLWKEWFPFGEKNTTLAVGILWTAFSTYVFPWLLDIAKVYCAFMIAQGFYNEHKGISGRDGRSGFSSFVYYGKWLIAFHLIPFGVELLDQVGAKMLLDIKSNPANG